MSRSMTQTTLTLDGLSCASCVGRAESALCAVPGVAEARVNLATRQARVRYDAPATEADLRRALETAGYPAAPSEDGAAAPDPEAARAREAAALRRATWIAGALTLPVLVLEMGGHAVPAFHHWLDATFGMQTIRWVQFVLATLVLAGPGRIFFAKGVPALLRAAPDMNALVALGTGAAWLWSAAVTVASPSVPP